MCQPVSACFFFKRLKSDDCYAHFHLAPKQSKPRAWRVRAYSTQYDTHRIGVPGADLAAAVTICNSGWVPPSCSVLTSLPTTRSRNYRCQRQCPCLCRTSAVCGVSAWHTSVSAASPRFIVLSFAINLSVSLYTTFINDNVSELQRIDHLRCPRSPPASS